MLADREQVESQLVGELGLLEQIAHPLLGGDAEARSAKVASPSSMPLA